MFSFKWTDSEKEQRVNKEKNFSFREVKGPLLKLLISGRDESDRNTPAFSQRAVHAKSLEKGKPNIL